MNLAVQKIVQELMIRFTKCLTAPHPGSRGGTEVRRLDRRDKHRLLSLDGM